MEESTPSTPLPRVTIQFCTQCKWMLRAAYFAQELLSTFSTDLGEVALQPSTGGTFTVHLYTATPTSTSTSSTSSENPSEEPSSSTFQKHLIWDRKQEGGFPETKILKRLIRNHIDPTRDLGHIDIHSSSTTTTSHQPAPSSTIPTITTLKSEEPATAIPKAMKNRLFSSEGTGRLKTGMDRMSIGEEEQGERKFTPMDLDTKSGRNSGVGSLVGSRDVSFMGGEGVKGKEGMEEEEGEAEEEGEEDDESEKVCKEDEDCG